MITKIIKIKYQRFPIIYPKGIKIKDFRKSGDKIKFICYTVWFA